MSPELEAVIRRELTNVAAAPHEDLTQWMNRAVRRIGAAVDIWTAAEAQAITERRATLADAVYKTNARRETRKETT